MIFTLVTLTGPSRPSLSPVMKEKQKTIPSEAEKEGNSA